ncbi:MAG: hypothetical protein MRY72_13140 [Aquisalinus sp.]|nr:hypothetical protein [Aquisalinus sp.]
MGKHPAWKRARNIEVHLPFYEEGHIGLLTIYDHILTEQEARDLPFEPWDFSTEELVDIEIKFRRFFSDNFDTLYHVDNWQLDEDRENLKKNTSHKILTSIMIDEDPILASEVPVEFLKQSNPLYTYYSKDKEIISLFNFDMTIFVVSRQPFIKAGLKIPKGLYLV